MSTVADPFAYLEDSNDPATIEWTAAQNARAREVLDGIAARPELVRRIEELARVDQLGVPVVRGNCSFLMIWRGEIEQASLHVREGDVDRVLLDPAALDPSALTAIDWWYPSPNGTYVAFGLSQNGDERSTLHVLEVASGRRLSEAIADTRYSKVSWLADESGFFYTRYPPGAHYGARAYRHELGADFGDDPCIFGEGRKPEETISLDDSADGRWLVATASLGWNRSDAYVADTHAETLSFVPLAEGIPALFEVCPGNGALYVRTDDGAPRFRLFEVDPHRPAREHWREILAEETAVLSGLAITANALALHYLDNVRSVLRFRRHDGTVTAFEGLAGATLCDWWASEDRAELYALSVGYFTPPVVQRIEISQHAATAQVWAAVDSPADATRYRVEQHWCVSPDGTRIPIDVLSRADLARDGTAPAVLYGYGGFSVSLLPSFSPTLTPWLDAGGVYAVANLRGGGEFGELWHHDGMRERKQNVFDDFIAAVEYLGTSAIADPARIAIYGGSNGGLLVAAVATQRPELLRAVVCVVPLTDMLRFHHFLIARLWIAEYGDPDVPADARILRAYSPYHRVRDGVRYPAMLIQTAESDSRVDPMHARKFAARVQTATAGDAPILLYVEPNAGHGVGKPRTKVVAELADRWAFLFGELGPSLR
jgi:prolyl oligopeptidase